MRIDRLKSFPGHLLRRAQQAITGIFYEKMAEYELTAVQFITLVAIDECNGLDATRLAEIICLDRATIGGVIERLERKGLIERRRHAQDQRIKVLATTPAGKAMITVCFGHVEEVQNEFLRPLDQDEQAQFMRLLARLVDAREPLPDMPEDI